MPPYEDVLESFKKNDLNQTEVNSDITIDQEKEKKNFSNQINKIYKDQIKNTTQTKPELSLNPKDAGNQNIKSFEDLNFHEKYSKKIHHIREKVLLEWLWKKPQIEDLLFTKIGTLDDKEEIVLFQGDSYMEQLTFPKDKNHISVELVQKFKSKKKVGFINAGIGSYSPSLMSLQLDLSLIHISEPTRRYAISYAVF